MAKRFIEREIFNDPFVRGLDRDLKLLWVYVFCSCDNAGIWPVEIDVACIRLGIDVKLQQARELFAPKIVELDSGMNWFLPSFVKIQHNNELSAKNSAVKKVIPRLLKYDLLTESDTEGLFILNENNDQLKGLYRAPIVKVKVEVEGKVEEEVKVEVEESAQMLVWPSFNDFWDLYDKKRSMSKAIKLWEKLPQKEKEAIMDYIPGYKVAQPDKQYRKDPCTFLRNKAWEDELINSNGNSKNKPTGVGSSEIAQFARATGARDFF